MHTAWQKGTSSSGTGRVCLQQQPDGRAWHRTYVGKVADDSRVLPGHHHQQQQQQQQQLQQPEAVPSSLPAHLNSRPVEVMRRTCTDAVSPTSDSRPAVSSESRCELPPAALVLSEPSPPENLGQAGGQHAQQQSCSRGAETASTNTHARAMLLQARTHVRRPGATPRRN
jgi:hypothetical protein